MDIEKVLDAIYEKANFGSNYKRTRGAPGTQVHDKGKRIRLDNSVIARYYQRSNGESFYEVFERHRQVFQLVSYKEKYFVWQPTQGKWVAQLGLEQSDVFGRQRTELDKLGELIIKKAWQLARKGVHFDRTEGEVRMIGRIYTQDSMEIRLMRLEHRGESSPTFLDIDVDSSFVFGVEMDNNRRNIRYNNVPYWREDFLKIGEQQAQTNQ